MKLTKIANMKQQTVQVLVGKVAKLRNFTQESENFSLKSQLVNIFSFVSHAISFTTTQHCRCP